MSQKPKSESDPPESAPTTVVRRAFGEVALSATVRIEMLLAAFGIAFAGLFLLVGWQFGPLVMVQNAQYRKLTQQVDARIVESWLALEFDAGSVRVPANWRASTNAAGCTVVEYDGEWGAPLRRAFCGTRVPFNDSYLLADIRDITERVPFAWARDEHGFVVPEMRVAPSTRQWLLAHAPDKFMHDKWPAKTSLDWLRLELDRPVDAAIYGWTAPPPTMRLSFDPAKPAEALPTGIVAKRMEQSPNWVAMAMGFGVGLFIWFKAMAFIPLLSNLAPWARWFLSALPLLTLPWWLDTFPQALSRVSRDLGQVVGGMFADVNRGDRLIASDPADATLANGDRLLWRLSDSVYADTFGQFKFAPPGAPIKSKEAAFAALTNTLTVQSRVLDDATRTALFEHLDRDKHADLKEVSYVFRPAAEEAAADPAASAETRRAASRFLQ